MEFYDAGVDSQVPECGNFGIIVAFSFVGKVCLQDEGIGKSSKFLETISGV